MGRSLSRIYTANQGEKRIKKTGGLKSGPLLLGVTLTNHGGGLNG